MEEEINLVDYIKVLFKQKWVILGIITVFIIGAAIFSFISPDTYQGTGVLEIGNMDIYSKGTFSSFTPETFSVVKTKIENGVYDFLNKEDLKPKKGNIQEIEVLLPKDEKDIDKIKTVTIKVQALEPDIGKQYVEGLLNTIAKEHNKEFSKKEKYFKSLISREKQKLSALEKNPNLSALQYLYVEHSSKIDDAEASLSSIEKTKFLEISDEFSQSKSSLILNLVLGFILGLFFGVVSAFLREFWQKNKKEILEG